MNTGTDHTADYKALAVLTRALIFGIVIFSVVSVVLHFIQGTFVKDESLVNTVFLVIISIAIVAIIGARIIYTKRTNVLKESNQTSKEKLDIFRAITITHMALCEMPALLGIICFLILGSYLFLIPVLMALAEMILKFPTQTKIESTINSGTF
jgi:hypothetical protein